MDGLVIIIAQTITVQRTAGGTSWSSRFLFCNFRKRLFLQLSAGSPIPRLVGPFQMYNRLQSGHSPVSITIWYDCTLLIELPPRAARGEMRGHFSNNLKTCHYKTEKEAVQDNQVICPIQLQLSNHSNSMHWSVVDLDCFSERSQDVLNICWMFSEIEYLCQQIIGQSVFTSVCNFHLMLYCCIFPNEKNNLAMKPLPRLQ